MSRFFGRKKGAALEDDEATRSSLFGNRTPQGPPSNFGNAPRGTESGYGGAPPPSYSSRGDNGYGSSSYAAQNPYAPRYGSNDGRLREGTSHGYGQQPQHQEKPSGYGQSGAGQETQGYDSEEESIKEAKTSIAFTKQKTVQSTENALYAADAALNSGLATLGRLGTQGEQLSHTEQNLNKAQQQNQIAGERARELKGLNGSMFIPRFTHRSSRRTKEEEDAIVARQQLDREERDSTREFGYESKNVVGRAFNPTNGRVESKGKSSLAERSRFQFEADSDDDAMEDKIDANLDRLGAITGQLKGVALATSKEVDRQNQQIDKIMKKSDRVDDQIALNHNRIRKIH